MTRQMEALHNAAHELGVIALQKLRAERDSLLSENAYLRSCLRYAIAGPPAGVSQAQFLAEVSAPLQQEFKQ